MHSFAEYLRKHVSRSFCSGYSKYDALLTLVSFIALIVSCISFYVTSLEQPKPIVYISNVMLFGHDKDGTEIFVLPITIANRGARDAVITKLNLVVTKQDATAYATFSSTHVGDNHRSPNGLFSPISVAGHSSVAKTLIFTRNNHIEDTFVDTKGDYSYCLSIETALDSNQAEANTWDIEQSLLLFRASSLSFIANIAYLDKAQLDAGQLIVMPIDVGTIARIVDAETTLPAQFCKHRISPLP